MDGFLIKSKSTKSTTPLSSQNSKSSEAKKGKQADFLTDATRKFEENNQDVGVDLIGDLKDNLENVTEFFDLVKELGNIKGEIQQIQFTDPYPEKEYRLIEMDSALLAEFEQGNEFFFRGGVDDCVVLCTETRTFDVRETETTNTLLLLPILSCGDDVAETPEKELVVRKAKALRRHYLELKPIPVVSLTRLRLLLHECELNRPEADSCKEGKRCYSIEDLLHQLQMSRGELMRALEDMPVIHFRDAIRWLSVELRCSLLDVVVEVLDAAGYDEQSTISLELLISRISHSAKFPRELLQWFLKSHCTVVDGHSSVDDVCPHRPLEREFCRTRALPLLLSTASISRSEMDRRITLLLPTYMNFKIEYLDGMALRTESMAAGELVEYFNCEELPDVPRERLALLFSRRARWTACELSPFLADLLPSPSALNSLLLQHCRAETDAHGEKIFCALKPL